MSADIVAALLPRAALVAEFELGAIMSAINKKARGDIDLVSRYKILIPKGAARNYTLTIYEHTVSEASGDFTRTKVDLTGSTIVFALKGDRDDTAEVLRLTSADTAEIEILTQSGATLGQAVLKLTSAQTDALTKADGCYWYEVWVTLADGRKDAVIDVSEFSVQPRIPVTI